MIKEISLQQKTNYKINQKLTNNKPLKMKYLNSI